MAFDPSIFREVEDMCRKYHVEMRSPDNIDTFLQQVNLFRQQKGKAAHLLFNEIEHDIVDKHSFLMNQEDGLEKMVQMFKTLIGKINVLNHTQKLLL